MTSAPAANSCNRPPPLVPGPGGSGAAAWSRAIAIPGLVVILCLHSLSLPGYILQVDAVFGPHAPAVTWGFSAPIELVTRLLGGFLAGRLWVAGALFLCGFGPMVLLRDRQWAAQVFAGLLASLNPWVFGRLVEGQWGVAAALGVLFLWLGAWEALERKPGWLPALLCAGFAWLAVTFDQHSHAVAHRLALASIVWHRSWRDRAGLVWAATSFGALAILLTYGWLPFFLDRGIATYSAVESFSRPDLLLFRSSSSPTYGLWANLIGLFGFWPERLGRIPLLNQGASWWPVTSAILAAGAVVGAWLRRDRAWLLPIGILGLLLAGSTATPPGLTAMLWLMHRLPLLGAFREPEKWSALWLVTLVVLGAETIAFLSEKAMKGRPAISGLAGVAAAGATLAVLLPNGLGAIRELPASIAPIQYPTSWTRVAAYMQENLTAGTKVVVLPWELYEPLAFTKHQLTGNPAPAVFPGHLVSPKDAEIPGDLIQPGPAGIGDASLRPRPASCALRISIGRIQARWVLVEPAPQGAADARELLACGFSRSSGKLPGPVLLHD